MNYVVFSLLCNLAPDVGRVTRNKLKAVMKTESSPVKETLSSNCEKQDARGRRRDGKVFFLYNDGQFVLND